MSWFLFLQRRKLLVGDRCMVSKLVQIEKSIVSKLHWWPKDIPKYMVEMEKTVGCRWVYAIKVGLNGKIDHPKA
jgi:hypothetical protein